MKRFNKYAALNKLDNKNNNKTKKRTIIVCVVVLIIGILYFSFARFESNSSFSLISGTIAESPVPIVEKMIRLAARGVSYLEYDGVTTLGENGTPDNNLRYVGSTPNNYIYFNCSTTNISEMNDSTCEKWRIIGLMNNVEDENGISVSRVKIMRDESLGYYSWDTSDNSINNGYGINQWGATDTYDGADLMRELNTDYLGNITVGTDSKWYNGSNNSKTRNMPTSTLNENTLNMIATVKWDTGSNVAADGPDWLPKTMYEYERSSNIGKDCHSPTYCNDSVDRTTSWVGKIALIYPSDYFYATSGGSTLNKLACLNTMLSEWNNNSSIDGISDCYANSWIKTNEFTQWTLSPEADYVMSSMVYSIGVNGLEGSVTADSPLLVRPSVYLESGIVIVAGNGSSSKPYKLVLK